MAFELIWMPVITAMSLSPACSRGCARVAVALSLKEYRLQMQRVHPWAGTLNLVSGPIASRARSLC
jgi:hypothetical protein